MKNQQTMGKMPLGTFINMGSILVGSLIGLMLQQVFPESIQSIVFQAVGLGILIIGIQMSLKLQEGMFVMLIVSLILGGILGEIIGIKAFLDSCAVGLKTNFQIGEKRFSEGLMAAFIIFCASPITIIGAIEEGFQKKKELLLVKSALDGITAIALASTYGGVGVLLSIIPLLIIQGGLTLLAGNVRPFFTKNIVALLSGVGGVLLIALAIQILDLAEFFVANLLPAFFVAGLVGWVSSKLKI